MKQSPTSDWSDEKIVECIHYWSAQSSKCGFDSDKYNKINFEYLVPCADMLKIRGPASLAKLLPLLDDENSEVRLATASIAYEVDKTACRKVLGALMKTPDGVGLMAWAALCQLDPSAAPTPTELWGEQP
jgi:hypothetical protein